MQLNIKTKNLELTEEIKDYLQEKIGGLEKFLENVGPFIVEVDIGRTTMHHKKGNIFRAEVQISVPGKLLRAVSETDNLKRSIVKVKNELQVQIKKYKDNK